MQCDISADPISKEIICWVTNFELPEPYGRITLPRGIGDSLSHTGPCPANTVIVTDGATVALDYCESRWMSGYVSPIPGRQGVTGDRFPRGGIMQEPQQTGPRQQQSLDQQIAAATFQSRNTKKRTSTELQK